MERTYGLGIDLGTTQTAAATRDDDGRVEVVRIGARRAEIPSLVFVAADGSTVVGEAAERRGLAEPSRLAREFKRRMGDPVPILVGGAPFSAHALTAKLLRHVLDEVTRLREGPPAAVTLTHPANWGPYKREQFSQAVRLADAGSVNYLTEPEAAALEHATARRITPGETVCVYDLGGGTFDVAVLRRDGDGFLLLGEPEGVEQLGGADFDEAVFAHVVGALGDAATDLDPDDPAVIEALTRLRRDCVEAKEALSFDTETSIPVALPGLHTRVRLNRSELESMILPALEDTVAATRRALRGAGVDAGQLSAVLLAGGSSRIPLVAQMLGEEFKRPVVADPHPEHSVAMGAGWATGVGTVPAGLPPASDPWATTSEAAPQSPAAQNPAELATTGMMTAGTTPMGTASPQATPLGAMPTEAVPPQRTGGPVSYRRGAASIPGSTPAAPVNPTRVDMQSTPPVNETRVDMQGAAPADPAWGAAPSSAPPNQPWSAPPVNQARAEAPSSAPPQQGWVDAPGAGPANQAWADAHAPANQPRADVPHAAGSAGFVPPPPAGRGNGAPGREMHRSAAPMKAPPGAPPPVWDGKKASGKKRSGRLVALSAGLAVLLVAGAVTVVVMLNNRDKDSGGDETAAPPVSPSVSTSPTPAPPYPTDANILVRVDTGGADAASRTSKVYSFQPGIGTERTELAGTVPGDTLPRWSHNRLMIALTHNNPGSTSDIYVMKKDGSDRRKLVSGVTDGRVTWSGDDTRITYVKKVGGFNQIFVMPVAGGEATQMTTSNVEKDDPFFTPDSLSIVYWVDRAGSRLIYALNAVKPKEPGRRITEPDEGPAVDPAVSPDHKWVVYTREAEDGNSDIWIVDKLNGGARRLTTNPEREMDPSWSPDGKWIAFTRGSYEEPKIVIMKMDGSSQTVMTADGDREGHACWF
ncbi:Hsp70 family protein [Actinoplanes bogorensis]|uniref:Hsp70 family protein n=1 Tax=Paractinoplanes bogorensis TaxID=1610840 RepID=A0ABS5YPG9_9ACTN|nr:Hsp70 family protein [Actinoplanes bogorensis]MBU2665350.1 Hsp70 family protein [Actinoplanes bogorensis]